MEGLLFLTADLASLLTATFCPAEVIFHQRGLALVIGLSPRIFDVYLYRFDRLLGLQSSFLAGQWFALMYASLPLAEVLTFLRFLRGQRIPANPLALFVFAGGAGLCIKSAWPLARFTYFQQCFTPPRLVPLQTMPLADIPATLFPPCTVCVAVLICGMCAIAGVGCSACRYAL